ncbi:hypothetical protein JRO89_XS13G0142100 [Xanthoceras sorbifolium]|uniref:Uncharacterized protein n=1 Tax=Xanthoceras sorbifolium TaxID=99658 RepID=A0ABQ8H896_9ROSI|nr:hypothetical protein JRO89_XS13G0142100 [Xanthoceras sorbifolium]
MEGFYENNLPLSFSDSADIRSLLSQLILTGGTNTIDSIFSHCSATTNTPTTMTSPVFEPLGSSDPSKLGFGDSSRLNALKNTVDAKIQAICQKVKRERAKKNAKKSVNPENNNGANESEKKTEVKPVDSCSSSSTMSTLVFSDNWGGELVSPAASEDGVRKSESSWPSISTECCPLMVADPESEFEGCSLARMPSYDPELIWEVLAN